MAGLRIIFMGTPDFAQAALKAITENTEHEIIALYSQPPRPKGRGQQVQKSPTHLYAEEQGISVHTPKSLKSAEEQAVFAALNADIAIIAAYGLILPKEILEAPRFGCINIHASLLPRWRGAAPIQRAIWEGDCETGITLMQMDTGLDTGDMLAKQSLPITATTTAVTLHDDLAAIAGKMICKFLNQVVDGNIPSAEIQDNSQTTYAAMLSRDDGYINWTQTATEIERQIRALTPWPGVWTQIEGTRLKIHDAEIIEGKTTFLPGIIRDKTGEIACGDGTILRLTKLQPAGKKAMNFASALNGGYVEIGDVFS